jgi:hypothetical protein
MGRRPYLARQGACPFVATAISVKGIPRGCIWAYWTFLMGLLAISSWLQGPYKEGYKEPYKKVPGRVLSPSLLGEQAELDGFEHHLDTIGGLQL